MWPTLDQAFSAVKKRRRKKLRGQASGWACRTRVQKFRVYLSQTVWTFGLLGVKMSKMRYFLQMTWFCRIQFFR